MSKLARSLPPAQTVAVIGAGPAGLFAAHALAEAGHQVALFEAHSKPGGSASYFRRKFYLNGQQNAESERIVQFDAGATVLNRFEPAQYLHGLLNQFAIEPAAAFAPIQSIAMHLPGESVVPLRCDSTTTYLEALRKTFPEDRVLIDGYLTQLARAAERLGKLFEKHPRMPIENAADLWANLRNLTDALPLLPFLAAGLVRNFEVELTERNISKRLFHWIEMNLLITLQCKASVAHPLYGALGFFFYALGAGSLDGGMKSLFLPMLDALKTHAQAKVYMRTPVTAIAIETSQGQNKFTIRTPVKDFGQFDAVFSSVPRYNTQSLTEINLFQRDYQFETLRPTLWSAFVGYFAVEDHPSLGDELSHLHSSRSDHPEAGGDVYLSFSRRGDLLRAPPGLRALVVSTHVRPDDRYFDGATYTKSEKFLDGQRMLKSHVESLYPKLKFLFEEYGSPKTFYRYTRRMRGTVGGLPLSLAHALWRAPSQRTAVDQLYQIGDTSFPGQSVYATAVGAQIAVERFNETLTRKRRIS